MYQPRMIERDAYDQNYEQAIKKLVFNFEEQQKEIDFLKSQLNKLKDRAVVNL